MWKSANMDVRVQRIHKDFYVMKTWLKDILDRGFVPYVATSANYLPHLDLSIFEGREIVRVLEDPAHTDFHEAYLVSNSLGFGNPDLKMPNWVYIDCVLMQSAVIGFALPIEKAPAPLVDFYEKDPWVNVDKLDYIPISGQIAGLGIDGQSLIGFSLFSLRRQLNDDTMPNLAIATKLAALHVYKAQQREKFLGIAQYNNKALVTHALFGEKLYIARAIMPLHPLRHMTFIYRVDIDLDEDRIFKKNAPAEEYDFLLRSDDEAMKVERQNRIQGGEKFRIARPVHITKEDGIYLPIIVEGK